MVLFVLLIGWVLMSVFGVWTDYLSLDFPLTIKDSEFNNQLVRKITHPKWKFYLSYFR